MWRKSHVRFGGRAGETDGGNASTALRSDPYTYVATLAGFLYLAIVLDVFSRRIVGWAMDSSLATDLVVGALEMAIAQRRPEDVIHHSDQGSQYTSLTFGKRCRDAGVALSMGSVGDCYDTPWPRASSPASNASCSTSPAFGTMPKPGPSSSGTSRAATTPIVVTPRSDTTHPSTSRKATPKLLDSPNTTVHENGATPLPSSSVSCT